MHLIEKRHFIQQLAIDHLEKKYVYDFYILPERSFSKTWLNPPPPPKKKEKE